MLSSDQLQTDVQTGRWTKPEHQRFLEGLKMYSKDWKQVQKYVGTRSGSQVRSHSQKYFRKIYKSLQIDSKTSAKEKKQKLSDYFGVAYKDKFFSKYKLTDKLKSIQRKYYKKKRNQIQITQNEIQMRMFDQKINQQTIQPTRYQNDKRYVFKHLNSVSKIILKIVQRNIDMPQKIRSLKQAQDLVEILVSKLREIDLVEYQMNQLQQQKQIMEEKAKGHTYQYLFNNLGKDKNINDLKITDFIKLDFFKRQNSKSPSTTSDDSKQQSSISEGEFSDNSFIKNNKTVLFKRNRSFQLVKAQDTQAQNHKIESLKLLSSNNNINNYLEPQIKKLPKFQQSQ